MAKTTTGHALSLIAEALEMDVSKSREKLLSILNDLRSEWYNLHNELALFIDHEICICPEPYHVCGHKCYDRVMGITLPPEMESPNAAWINEHDLKIYSKWNDWKHGVQRECYSMTQFPGEYPTTHELLLEDGKKARILFKCENENDVGKVVRFSCLNGDTLKDYELELSLEYTGTNDAEVTNIVSVTLPDGLIGGVTIAQEMGGGSLPPHILSKYRPSEKVPCYQRWRIDLPCSCRDKIRVRGNKRYSDIYWDDDLIETDNRSAIKEGALYINYKRRGTDPDLIQKASIHYNSMLQALRGELSRSNGKFRDDLFEKWQVNPKRSGLRTARRRGGYYGRR